MCYLSRYLSHYLSRYCYSAVLPKMSSFRSIVISWLLFSVRETMGLTVVRNEILQSKINKLKKYPKNAIYYGKTFCQGDTFKDIYELFDDFEASDKQYLIFTSNGEIVMEKRKKMRFETIESHYVTFILNKKERIAIIIDPSRNNGKIGIYNPYIGICLEPFFESEGYKVKWLEMTNSCQLEYHDVFCQSWTLYLAYMYMKNQETTINIPKKQRHKYKKLLNFFKNLLNYEIFVNELDVSYKNNIKTHRDFGILKNYNPSQLLRSMKTVEMNDNDDDDDEQIIDLSCS